MEKEQTPTLTIDSDFRELIRPLNTKEYLQLEENILADGCRDPIVTWNGIIVDGHNRYEICKRHGLPFTTVEMDFDSRESAAVWICLNQLGRRNISEETRKYLIGIQYENEKVINARRNPKGINQYSYKDGQTRPRGKLPFPAVKTYTMDRVAVDHHVSRGTVQKYARYANALETIRKKDPKLFPKILSGRYKISHENVVQLSTLPPEEIKKLEKRLDNSAAAFVQYKGTRSELEKVADNITQFSVSVKDMPEYDPDAEIVGLTLTIPSWKGSIERVIKTANLKRASIKAKSELLNSLNALQEQIKLIIETIKE